MLTPGELGGVAAVVLPTMGAALLLLRRLRMAPLTGLHVTALVVEVAVYLSLNLAWGQPVEEIEL